MGKTTTAINLAAASFAAAEVNTLLVDCRIRSRMPRAVLGSSKTLNASARTIS